MSQELFNDIRNFSIQWVLTLKFLFENLRIHRDSNSQSGSSLESVGVHSLTFSCTPKSMKCDSQASHLVRTFASLCLDYKPKVRVVTCCHLFTKNEQVLFTQLKKTKKIQEYFANLSILQDFSHECEI